jgi:hypothetical protein
MIEELTDKSKVNDLVEIVQVLDCEKDDFYFTRDNQRIYAKSLDSLKEFLKESYSIFYINDADSKGIILVWKSVGIVTRNYIKIIASDAETARKLVTVLLWSFKEKLYIKIRKDSIFLSVFKEKGFTFLGGRGKQTLLEKSTSFGETLNVSDNNKK